MRMPVCSPTATGAEQVSKKRMYNLHYLISLISPKPERGHLENALIPVGTVLFLLRKL